MLEELEPHLTDFEERFGAITDPQPAMHQPSFCRECDDMTRSINPDDSPPHRPCGHTKGIQELQADSPDDFWGLFPF